MDVNESNIEKWKIRRLIKSLNAAKGNGTSMISLIIPAKDQVAKANKMLVEEFGTASNIKSTTNRQSVLTAITSTRERLKLYNKTPPNGLVIFCGTVISEEGKGEKKVTIDFEPFKPINTSLYLCDNRFHTEDLEALLEEDEKYGFIVMDGSGSLFGTVQGNAREVLHKFGVDLPKKHGRGGQSAMRFARLRMEKRHNYVRKVAELSTQHFITNDKPNISGLVLAGSADFKNELQKSEMFDQRLTPKILKVVDVSYGGENGFNQAILLAEDALKNVKFVQEKKLVGKFFEEVAQDTGKYIFGIEDTLKALEMGAIDTLVVYENLDVERVTLKNNSSGEEIIKHLSSEKMEDDSELRDENGVELEIREKQTLTDWLVEHYKDYGASLEFITNKSQEGFQFFKGFGGIGGFLRYKLDFMEYLDEDDEYFDSDEDFM
eukprot:CAMPEP_0115016056 /NCGR_PEP_ID=MMETSP0216-20121206/27181_1 /TAXON_ID=223996 /ORGANISM="Protocruzia adherens, Strain Boccale" /LENGTH=433 /DNA_ID=CAMNT_0002386383 /DNA_START=69 /DNA_END=1370 /DNA_ORIENTATION=+